MMARVGHIKVVAGRINIDENRGGTKTRNCGDGCEERIRSGDDLIPWTDILGHETGQQGVAARGNADRMRAGRVCGNGLFAVVHLRAQDEMLGLEYFCDGRINFGLDGRILRLKVEQRNIHTSVPP